MENLQYKVKDLTTQVNAYKSGEKYQAITAFYDSLLASKDREIRKVKLELAEVRTQYVNVRNNWQEVIEDLETEHIKALAKKDRAIAALWRRIVKLEKENEELHKKSQERIEKLYAALHPPDRLTRRKSLTTEKKQAESLAVNPVIRDIAADNMSQQRDMKSILRITVTLIIDPLDARLQSN